MSWMGSLMSNTTVIINLQDYNDLSPVIHNDGYVSYIYKQIFEDAGFTVYSSCIVYNATNQCVVSICGIEILLS